MVSFQNIFQTEVELTRAEVLKILKFTNFVSTELLNRIARNMLVRQGTFKRRLALGKDSGFGSAPGLIHSALVRHANDPQIRAEIGLPSRYQPEKSLKRPLQKALSLEFRRPNRKLLQAVFSLEYETLRSETPHPARHLPSGRNIRVVSWLDWLHGEAQVSGFNFQLVAGKRASSSRAGKGRTFGGIMTKGGVWKISKPLSFDWITENSEAVGVDVLDFLASKFVPQTANGLSRSLRNLRF